MISIKNEKDALRQAIGRYADMGRFARGRNRAAAAIEDAILALDNAAYDRAYTVAHKRYHAECYEALVTEVEHLTTERDQARQDATTMTLTNDDKRQEIKRLEAERDRLHQQWARCIKEGSARRPERDRLKQDLEFADHRREQAEKACADAQSDLGIRDRDADDHADDAIRLREELASVRERGYRDEAERIRLRKALETLADRYHAQLCRGRAVPHSRSVCPVRPRAVQEAEKALAGESGLKIGSDTTLRRAQTDHVLFDARKPKEQPEIEAVLMGTEIICACGCGVTVSAGRCAYRYVTSTSWLVLPLYASEEHARKQARPKARTHPPYAAYTDEMRREEEAAQKPPEAPTTPEPEFVYECAGFIGSKICGWTGGPRDLSQRGLCPQCFRAVRIVEKLP